MIADLDIDGQTQVALSRGHRIFQIYRLAQSDRDHARALLDMCDFPVGARVLDAGCGVGEVSRLFREMRPDLDLILLNNNAYQLDQCPEWFEQVFGEIEHTGLKENSFDAVMAHYALGYTDIGLALAEISRLLRPGGVLFVSDIIGDPALLQAFLKYRPHSIVDIMRASPLTLDWMRSPRNCRTEHMEGLAAPGVLRAVLGSTRPILYRMVKP